MEFPELGKHCNQAACHQLDFLPVRCDACKKIFCSEHYKYDQHNCQAAHSKDVQVPVCPLCNRPVPGRSDELPDIRVSRHIDSDCQSDKAVNHRNKVYSNKCTVKGCKQKEMIPVICDNCGHNYCLRHRHPQDHSCTQINGKPMSKGAAAALARSKMSQAAGSSNRSHSYDGSRSNTNTSVKPAKTSFSQSTIQGNLSDDVALQLALQASLSGTATAAAAAGQQQALSQEQEDFLLAQAIAQSEREARQNSSNNRGSSTSSSGRRNCYIS